MSQYERYLGSLVTVENHTDPTPNRRFPASEIAVRITAVEEERGYLCRFCGEVFQEVNNEPCPHAHDDIYHDFRFYRHTSFTAVHPRRGIFTLCADDFRDRNGYCALHSSISENPRCVNPHDHCRHGVYVGGCGPDYMCGACELGEEAE